MIEILVLAAVFAAGTWLGGWWSVALVAAIWSIWRRRPAWRAGLAAAMAWTGLLALTIPWAPLGRVAARLGGVLGLPGWAALALPPIFALLLGWSAARVAGGVAVSSAQAYQGRLTANG